MNKERTGWMFRTVFREGWRGICLTLLWILASGTAWSAGPPPDIADKVGARVFEQLTDTGSVNVMIALEQPPALARGRGLNMAAMKSEIGQMQRSVMAGLDVTGYQAKHTYSAVPAMAGRVKSTAALEALARHPHVLRIDVDEGGTGSLANSVPVTGADLRHILGNTGVGVVVAVLDSGMDTDHSNLGDNLVAEACFADDDGAIDGVGQCPNGSDRQTGPGAAEDDAGHGTHVTGIVTSNGTLGSVGVAPDASIVAVRVTYGPNPSGSFAFFSEIVAGLNFIIANPQLGVQIINMSLGTNSLFTGDCDNASASAMAGAAAVNTLRANGVTTFASAGNNSSTTQMSLPACLSNVLSVGASDNADAPAGFTNSNAQTDIFAPGVSVVSSDLANTTSSKSGTSMASPHAAGCAALLIQTGEATTPNQIETRLETSPFTVTVPGNGLTFPRIDCRPVANVPPVCDANGPYTAECGLTTVLDGTGSIDPDGGMLSYLWSGPIVGGTTSGPTPVVVFPTPTGLKSVNLTVDDGEDADMCSSPVTVEDTLAPSVTAPADVTAECTSPTGTPVEIGMAFATDSCDPAPVVSSDEPALFPFGDTTVTWMATDGDGNQSTAVQTVTVEDTTPPLVLCNNSPTITPPDAPISFTATAEDQCEGPLTAEITGFQCFKFTKKGKLVRKNNSCVISTDGDQITILDSGGVADMIEWTATATDASGNATTETCSLMVVNPSGNP